MDRPVRDQGARRGAAARARSAGLLLHRRDPERGLLLLLVHMGGPFWARRDEGAWSIPKGEHEEGEDPLAVARREFLEELGQPPPAGEPLDLGEVRQAGGKRVRVYALEGDLDVAEVRSNTFTMEWPRGSGRFRSFPEVDRAEWMEPEDARRRIIRAQAEAIDRLVAILEGAAPGR